MFFYSFISLNNKRKKMIFELKDIDGKHFLCIMDYSSVNDDRLDDSVIERWKSSNNKTVYLSLNVKNYDSLLLEAEIYHKIKYLKDLGFEVSFDRLDSALKDSLELAFKKSSNTAPIENDEKVSLLEEVGVFSFGIYKSLIRCICFTLDAFVSVVNFIGGKAIFRKKDFWFIFADCSYKAVGIISVVSFLVGLIVAFVGAIQLKSFGAGIYVASMVSIGMTRIMSAIMVGIVMAGRTGSAFAATLGTMQVSEEIDALKTMGVKVSEYLVAPRIISLVSVMVFLTLLADVLGILGGAVVGVGFLNISSSSYFDFAFKALSLNNILIGMFHSLVYGVIISIAGCYEGLNATRDANSVGKATTNAVVEAIVWMIVATGIITVLLEVIGI